METATLLSLRWPNIFAIWLIVIGLFLIVGLVGQVAVKMNS